MMNVASLHSYHRVEHGITYLQCQPLEYCSLLDTLDVIYSQTNLGLRKKQQLTYIICTCNKLTATLLPIKRTWALETHGPKNGVGRLHGEAICTYNAYTHGP